MSSIRQSKTYRKKLRLEAFQAMTVEQQAQDRLSFYTKQSALPKYQRKLANFSQVWDEKLMDSVRQWPEFRLMNRDQAQVALSRGGMRFIIRPSSFPGYLSATYIANSKYNNVLFKYQSGKLCCFTKEPDAPLVYACFYESQGKFREEMLTAIRSVA